MKMIEPAKAAAVASRFIPARATAIRERRIPESDRNVIGILVGIAISNRQVRVVAGLRFRSVEYVKRTVARAPDVPGRILSTVRPTKQLNFRPRDSLQGTDRSAPTDEGGYSERGNG